MERIENHIIETILRLSKSVKRIDNNKKTINYKTFFGKGEKDSFYDKLGHEIVKLVDKNDKYSIFSKLDYSWAIENKHPIVKYSSFYRGIRQEESKDSVLNVVDLFCGAGGLSLGFVQNGFEIALANDIDESCIYTYTHNHPSVPLNNIILGDIGTLVKNIKEHVRFSEVDVVVGGPPCQGFSMANRQRIKNDPRNKLYKYFIEAINILKPRLFVMENVKGMKNVADQVVEDFEEIGYFTSFYIFNAKDFSVPQNRERLIFIGTRTEGEAGKILKNIQKKSEKCQDYVLKDALYGLPNLKASSKKNSTKAYDESGGLILELEDKSTNEYIRLINNNKKQFVVLNGKARYNNSRDIEIYGRLNQGDDSTDIKIDDIMPYKSRFNIFKDKYYKLVENGICKTITAHMRYDCNMYIHPTQARGLTPREAARIQSYPDDYFFQGPYTKTYMQIGNSVPPLLGKAISSSVLDYLRRKL